jgi:uncharacterized SAM-binding protein YcdF (DUF218 family)
MKNTKKFIKGISLVLLIGIILSGLSFLAIRSEWNAVIEEPGSVDVLIVLGSGVWGTEPSPQLKLRLNTAAKVIQKNPTMTVIVSGGQGPDEDVSEAKAMRDYLVQLDVPSESILLENRSTSTVENLIFSKAILDTRNMDTSAVGIVTTDFHMYRAKMLARRYGMSAQGESAPNVPIIVVKNTMREIVAVIKDIIIR